MKISNESKIGALTAVAITFLILGFNFLKGRSLFKTGTFIYGKYTDTKKLMPSNPVFINGFQIGSVYDLEASDNNISTIVVSIKLNGEYNIPNNSVASIESSPLGSPSISISSGNSNTFLKSGDTMMTENNVGLLGELSGKISPVADRLKATLTSLDTLLKNFNTVLDPNTKGNLQSVIANLNKVTASLVESAASLPGILNEQSGTLTKSMNNINSFTKNLADNNEKVSNTLSNIEKTTENLSKADIDGVINNLKSSIDKLNGMIAKLNSTDGTIGALINQKETYNNLNSTVRSMNILIDDLRAHPKRYVNISVFGKKDKGGYLTEPLADSTTSSVK